MLKLMATLPPGLEEEASKELEMHGARIYEVRRLKGRVFFECQESTVVKINQWARCIERVIAILLREQIYGLEKIYSLIKSLDFSRWIETSQSFAVRVSRVGEHPYTSMDIAREAGRAVIEGFMTSTGVRLRVNLNHPDVIIRVYQIEDELIVGVDTTGDWALHKRGYRVYSHPAALNPCIASAMIMMSGWKPSRSLIDPMCGGGTIPIEAALKGLNMPPVRFRRKPLALCKLKVFQPYLEEFEWIPPSKGVKLDLWGLDASHRHIAGALENAKVAGVSDMVRFMVGDATRLEKIFNRKFDYSVVNPPYGLRSASPKALVRLYNGLTSSLAKLLNKRLVVITHRLRTMHEALELKGFEIEAEKPVKHGNLPCWILSAKPP